MVAKTKIIVMPPDSGRDKGKQFLLTEMKAYYAEKWAIRVFQAASRSGMDIPLEVISQGMAAISVYILGAFVHMSWQDSEPLLEELMKCVKIIRDPAHPDETTFDLTQDDIEEVRTFIYLRMEVMQLHTNFSLGGNLSQPSSPQPMESVSTPPSTPTSPRRSVRLSPRKPPRL